MGTGRRSYRVLRGGSWNNNDNNNRCANRNNNNPNNWNNNNGFRLVRSGGKSADARARAFRKGVTSGPFPRSGSSRRQIQQVRPGGW